MLLRLLLFEFPLARLATHALLVLLDKADEDHITPTKPIFPTQREQFRIQAPLVAKVLEQVLGEFDSFEGGKRSQETLTLTSSVENVILA